jgi:itaconyl-CoA hydratase
MPLFAHRRLGPGRYRERVGLDFEELAAGQRFRHRPGLTLSQQDNTDEALATSNQAMLHFDAVYAGCTEWRRPLVVSTLTLRVVLGMTAKTFGQRAAIASFDEIAMTRPVFGGDTLYAESEVVGTAPEPGRDDVGAVTVRTVGLNQRGEVVCRAVYRALVYRAGRSPWEGSPAAEGPGKSVSHREVGPMCFVEQSGVDYEDFEIGEVYEHRPGRTFTADMGLGRALGALEQSPRLVEIGAGRAAHGGRLVIGEADVVGTATALTTKTFGKVVANLGWTNVALPHPVYEGDTIHATSTVLGARDSASRPGQGVLHVLTEAATGEGRAVCRFERRLLVYKRGLGPYAEAGY